VGGLAGPAVGDRRLGAMPAWASPAEIERGARGRVVVPTPGAVE